MSFNGKRLKINFKASKRGYFSSALEEQVFLTSAFTVNESFSGSTQFHKKLVQRHLCYVSERFKGECLKKPDENCHETPWK